MVAPATERHRPPAPPRQHFPGPQLSCQHLRSERRRLAFEAQGQHATLHPAAPLHARGGLLADETALGEVDPAEQVEIRLDRIGPVRDAVPRRVRSAERQSMAVVGVLVHAIGAGRGGQVHAPESQGAEPGIRAPAGGRRLKAPEGGHHAIVRRDAHLRAQPVHHQTLHQRLAPRGLDVEPAAVLAADDEEVEQQPALRGQQGAEPRLSGLKALHVLTDQVLQEVAPVGAAQSDQGAAGKGGDGRWVRHGDAVKDRSGGAPAQ